MLKDKLRKIRGFALVEFIVVMIVIAVLIALALPYYNGMTAKALETKLRNDARVVQDACDYFYGHNGEYPYLLDSEGNKIIAANNNGYFDVIYKVVDFDPTNTDVNFYEIDFNKLRSYLNVDSNPGYFLAAHGNPDFGIVVLNPVSQVTQDRIENINGAATVTKEKPVIAMEYPEGVITTDTIITWSYTYDYDILEEEWEGKQEYYPAEGEYTVRLRVKNQNGVWSDWAEHTFYVFNRDEVIQIVAGDFHTVVLKNDGTVWSWGRNDRGQLGDNTKIGSSTPVQVKDGENEGTYLSNITSIAAGYYHTVALKNDGTVWSWGYNNYGQLGDGKTTDSSTPVQVVGASGGTPLSNVASIAAGRYYTVALKTDGTVWSWGCNSYGQLGDNSTIESHIPVQVKDDVSGETYLSNVISIVAGCSHTVALKTDGTVWSWGWNNRGQLGDNTTVNSSIPVQVKVGVSGETCLSNVASIAAGHSHTVALKTDGTVWSWGYNYYGQLGDNTTTYRKTSVQVEVDASSGTCLSNVASIAAGESHTVALKTDGTVWSWGYNSRGQLGDGTTTDRHTPVQVVGASSGTYISNISSIAAGQGHTVVLKDDGTVWSWGYNSNGQLGDGTTTESHTPVQSIFPW